MPVHQVVELTLEEKEYLKAVQLADMEELQVPCCLPDQNVQH